MMRCSSKLAGTSRRAGVVALASALAAPATARALPLLDSGTEVFALSRGEASQVAIFGDSEDPHLHYLAWQRLELRRDSEGELDFGFSYSRTGAVFAATVAPVVDEKAARETIAAIKAHDPEARFQALPIHTGTYSLSLQSPSSETILIAPGTTQRDDLGNPWSFTLTLSRPLADLIVTGLSTGAVFGVNYRYTYVAAIEPRVLEFHFEQSTLLLALSSRGDQTQVSLARVVEALVRRGLVTITTSGEGSTNLDLAELLLVETLGKRCYIAGEGFEEGKLKPDVQRCSRFLADKLRIVAPRVYEATAAAGMSVGGMCRDFAGYFSFEVNNNAFSRGCPDRVLPAPGERVTAANAPRALLYTPLLPAVPTPLLAPSVTAGPEVPRP